MSTSDFPGKLTVAAPVQGSVYDFDFDYAGDAELHVTFLAADGAAAVLDLNTDYTVDPTGRTYGGGQLTLLAEVPAGSALVIDRATRPRQGTAFKTGEQAFERQLDGVAQATQDVQRRATFTVARTASTAFLVPELGTRIEMPPADALSAGTMTAADRLKLDGLQNTLVTVDPAHFSSAAQATATALSAAQLHLRTAGFLAPGDGGGGVYVRRDAITPTHPAKITPVGGIHYELATGTIRPEQLGTDPDNADTGLAAMVAAVAGGVTKQARLASGRTYTLTGGAALALTGGMALQGGGRESNTKILQSTLAQPVLDITGLSNVELRGLEVTHGITDEADYEQAGSGITNGPVGGPLCEGLVLADILCRAISNQGVILNAPTKNLFVPGFRAFNCGRAGLVLQNAEGALVTDFHIDGTGDDAIAFNASSLDCVADGGIIRRAGTVGATRGSACKAHGTNTRFSNILVVEPAIAAGYVKPVNTEGAPRPDQITFSGFRLAKWAARLEGEEHQQCGFMLDDALRTVISGVEGDLIDTDGNPVDFIRIKGTADGQKLVVRDVEVEGVNYFVQGDKLTDRMSFINCSPVQVTSRPDAEPMPVSHYRFSQAGSCDILMIVGGEPKNGGDLVRLTAGTWDTVFIVGVRAEGFTGNLLQVQGTATVGTLYTMDVTNDGEAWADLGGSVTTDMRQAGATALSALAQTISNPPTQAEVAAIQTLLNSVLAVQQAR